MTRHHTFASNIAQARARKPRLWRAGWSNWCVNVVAWVAAPRVRHHVLRRGGCSALHMNSHHSLLLVVTFALSWGAAGAAVAEVRSGDTVVVAAGERVDGNLYISAGTALVHGEVDGDLVVAGGTIVVDGHVTGDVLVVGGDVDIRGAVDGDLRAAAGSLRVEATQGNGVRGDLTATGGDVTLTSPVGGSALVAGGVVVVGDVGGDVLLAASDARLLGKVGGDVDIGGTRARLEHGATVAGHLVFTGDDLYRAPGAVVVGAVAEHPGPSTAGLMVAMWLQGLVGICLFGALWFTLFRNFATRATTTLTQQPVRSLAVGLLVLMVSPVVLGIAFAVGLVVGGWWIAVIGAGVYATALATTFPLVAGAIARRGLSRRHRSSSRAQETWAMLGVLVLLSILAAVPILGGLLGFVVAVCGLGAVVLTARPASTAATSHVVAVAI